MRKKTPAEMERHKVTKTVRTIVRLKHSLAADEELNAVLPATLSEFDEALARGELLELKVPTVGEVVGGDDASGA